MVEAGLAPSMMGVYHQWVKLPIRGGVNENVQNLHTVVTHEGERVPRKTHRQSIGGQPPVPNPMSFLRYSFHFTLNRGVNNC